MSNDYLIDMNKFLEYPPRDHDGDNDDDAVMNPLSAAPLLDAPSVFLSVVDDGPLLAFCAYDEGTDTLYIETARANGFQVESVVSSVLRRLQPTLLLLPTRVVSNAGLLQVLTTPILDEGDTSQQHVHPTSTPYKIVKSSWLDVTKCRSMVLSLRVKSLLSRPDATATRQPRQRHPQQVSHSLSSAAHGVSYYNALASLIDFDSKVLIQAMGSLLLFLQGSTLFMVHHPSSDQHNTSSAAYNAQDCHVSHLERLSLDHYVWIPPSTMEALHIFRTDHHPLALAGGGKSQPKSKEGYSLASWMDRTHFADAKARFKEWMHQPLRSVAEIQRRQDGVELFASCHQFVGLADTLAEHARHLKPAVSSILARFAKNTSSALDFVRLAQTLTCAVGMCQVLEQQVLWKLKQWDQQVQWQVEQRQQWRMQQPSQDGADEPNGEDEADTLENDIPPVRDYIAFVEYTLNGCHVPVLQSVLQQIVETIDIKLTAETLRFSVLPGVSADLDAHKADLASLTDILQRSAENILRRFPNLPFLKVVFFPQLGYFVSMEGVEESAHSNQSQLGSSYHGAVAARRDIYSDLEHDDNMRLEWVFREHTRDYYKTYETYQLDRDIGDIDITVKNDEFMIASALEDEILEYCVELRQTYSMLADLDCILSFAETAREYNLVRPVVVPPEENCILIMNGGHPLQEHAASGGFVRNHTTIDETDRVTILSGPNYSGKSCYARQVGILTYMAHLGCFLPCAGARISVVDRILAQFSGVETCLVPQSSFQLDLTSMGGILRTATQHSLVLIDEFGKGTSPASGIALLAASLQNLSEIGCKVVCTTHFLEIFSVGLLADGENGVRAMQMTVNFPQDVEELAVPSFELVNGLSTSSAGLACARLSGVKASVIARAREIVVAMREGRTIRPLDEILLRALHLADTDKFTIHDFISMDLKTASRDAVDKLRIATRKLQSIQ